MDVDEQLQRAGPEMPPRPCGKTDLMGSDSSGLSGRLWISRPSDKPFPIECRSISLEKLNAALLACPACKQHALDLANDPPG